ncbi:hypothetical protein RM533_04400 [Croceicoccus sp. F390]|uniref:PAS domain-containing protein n=1 Tax=Croceicoccus esteveae TaxID=3075597 RepID=A0ABU2ZGH7_9SPHN|nr:hypothetical protein [Croceicoccus sp. F390]MDT0575419.1 hypothetical protein [Croceicoccus sp. F390]
MRDESTQRDLPPPSFGQAERRMQLRARDWWVQATGNRPLPSLERLHELIDDPRNAGLDLFSVLLTIPAPGADPQLSFIGECLSYESGVCDRSSARAVHDLPLSSPFSFIISRLPDVLTRRSFALFEDDGMNRHSLQMHYRGVLLPFSRRGDVIDHVLAIVTWREMADDPTLLALKQDFTRSQSGQWAGACSAAPIAPRPLEGSERDSPWGSIIAQAV